LKVIEESSDSDQPGFPKSGCHPLLLIMQWSSHSEVATTCLITPTGDHQQNQSVYTTANCMRIQKLQDTGATVILTVVLLFFLRQLH
jgi:hypothetical protein